jgi:hypothetical protein
MTVCNIGRPAHADTYAVAGRFISVESDDAHAAGLFRGHFDGWHVAPLSGAVKSDPDAKISVSLSDEPPRARAGSESFEVAGGGVCSTDGGDYFFEYDGAAIRVRAETPSLVEVWVGGETRAGRREALARLIFNAAATALRRCGLYELHAAGLVAPKGAGLLAVGPSGSGKSTIATQLAAAGWRYLSDDTLLLSSDGGEVSARALRRVFAVAEPTLATGVIGGFEARLEEPAPFDPLKRRFEPQEVFPGGFAASCVPRVLVFPSVSGGRESRARRLTQAETMSRLIRMCPWACYDKPAAGAHLAALALLARRAAGFELFAGADLFGDAGRASRFFQTFAEAAP